MAAASSIARSFKPVSSSITGAQPSVRTRKACWDRAATSWRGSTAPLLMNRQMHFTRWITRTSLSMPLAMPVSVSRRRLMRP